MQNPKTTGEYRRPTHKKKQLMDKNDEQKHFVLVHGACHGAWCWFKLETLLTSAGHKVTSLDLAASGMNPKQVQDLQSIADYYEPLMEFMASLPEDEKVILVGHSFNGLSISVAMERFPSKVSVAVFISATMPSPTNTVVDMRDEYDRKELAKTRMQRTNLQFDRRQVKDGIDEILPTPEKLAKQYERSPPEDLTLATKLIRPIGVFKNTELSKEMALSEERYGSVSRVYILCDEDDDLKDFLNWVVSKNPPDEVKEIPGSDHMVMISKPLELCAYLQEIAHRYS